MSQLWGMVRKDLLRQWRSPLAIASVLAFPLVFAGLLALTFGGGGDSSTFRVRLLIEDRDQSVVSGLLVSAAGRKEVARFFETRTVGAEGQSIVEAGDASALLRIPEGFGAALLDGTPTELELIRNPAESILPEIAEQGLGVLAELLDSASRALREPLSEIADLSGRETGPTAAEVSAVAVAVYATIDRAEALVLPPVITLAPEREVDESAGGSTVGSSGSSGVFLFVLPGISVWSLFLLGDMAMRDVLVEGRFGTLRRQLSGPVQPWIIVSGKAAVTAVLATISLVLLSAIGWAITRTTAELLPFLTLSAAVILAVTGYASVVYGLAGTERQGATISSIVLLVFAFIGGSFLPLDNLPGSVRSLAPVSPFYWGTTGYQAVLLHGGGLKEIARHVAVLTLIGAVLLALGAAMLGRKVRRGADL